jgi:hypothetical protein
MRDHREPQPNPDGVDQPGIADELRKILQGIRDRPRPARPRQDITPTMRRNGPKFQPTPDRARRRAKRKQQAASRRTNRSNR